MARSNYSKIYFIFLVLISIAFGLVSFFYFRSQPQVYRSVGKFSVSYAGGEEFAAKEIYTTNYNLNLQTEAKSLTEGIKSRIFVESLLKSAKVAYDPEILDNIDQIISASVIKDSNIVTVEAFSNSANDLEKINRSFLTVLNSSQFVTSQDPKIQIKAVDPLYSNNIPIYPETIKYSLLASACSFFLGVMLYFIFKPQNDKYPFSTNSWS